MIRLALLLLALCLAWSSHAQQREQRVALVIGNGAYKSAPLRNPVNDAKDMADKLRGLGFVVIERSNLGIKQIGSTLREFRAKLVRSALRVRITQADRNGDYGFRLARTP